MPRSDEARIGDIVEAGQRIKKHIADLTLEDFRNNDTSMRDVVVHQYFGIEVKTVWNAATVSVPNVLKVLMSASS